MKTLGIFLVLLLSVAATFAAEPGTAPQTKQLTRSMTQTLQASSGLVPVVSETGKLAWSIDSAGTSSGSSLVTVNKPAGATVRGAYLMAVSQGFTGYQITSSDVTLAGSPVSFTTEVPSGIQSFNYFTDVTAIVKPLIDAAPAGATDLAVTEGTSFLIDGVALVVLFDDPSKPDSTVILAFGALQPTGDTFNIGLADPINKNLSGFGIDLSLGIGYSYQNFASQYSQVDVNGVRLTTSAGGSDDGEFLNGALITVGGEGDTNANPADPNYIPGNTDDTRYDDELYDLSSFVNNGDTAIVVDTLNPSNDDNVFFAGLLLAGSVAVVGEGIVLSPTSDTLYTGQSHTVTATAQNTLGDPLVGIAVTFEIVSGPNAGLTQVVSTDSQGKAQYTWTSSLVGTDEVRATFVNSQQVVTESNHGTVTWELSPVPKPTVNIGMANKGTVSKDGKSVSLVVEGTCLADSVTQAVLTIAQDRIVGRGTIPLVCDGVGRRYVVTAVSASGLFKKGVGLGAVQIDVCNAGTVCTAFSTSTKLTLVKP